MTPSAEEIREAIAKKYIMCICDEGFTSRGLTQPGCPFHDSDWEAAMEEYAELYHKELFEEKFKEWCGNYESTDPRYDDWLMGQEKVWIKFIEDWKPGEINSGLGEALENKFKSYHKEQMLDLMAKHNQEMGLYGDHGKDWDVQVGDKVDLVCDLDGAVVVSGKLDRSYIPNEYPDCIIGGKCYDLTDEGSAYTLRKSPQPNRVFTEDDLKLFAEFIDDSDYTAGDGKWFKMIFNGNTPLEYQEVEFKEILTEYIKSLK
jgi:hypothetical protein